MLITREHLIAFQIGQIWESISVCLIIVDLSVLQWFMNYNIRFSYYDNFYFVACLTSKRKHQTCNFRDTTLGFTYWTIKTMTYPIP